MSMFVVVPSDAHTTGHNKKPKNLEFIRPPYCNAVFNAASLSRMLFQTTDGRLLSKLDIRHLALEPDHDRMDNHDMFDLVPNLTKIYAGNNFLDVTTFREFPLLQRLELQNNHIKQVLRVPPDKLTHLVFLDLTANNIDKISSLDALSQLPRLGNLNLNFNNLSAFAFTDRRGFTCLEILTLRGNKITQCDMCFAIQSLRELNLAENCLEKVDMVDDPSSSHLWNLNLASNRLRNVADIDALKSLASLRMLDLTGNSISRNDRRMLASNSVLGTTCRIVTGDETPANQDDLEALMTAKPTSNPIGSKTDISAVRSKTGKTAIVKSKRLGHVRPAATLYEIPQEELESLIAGWQHLPRPDTLRQCYQEIDALLRYSKTTVDSSTSKSVKSVPDLGSLKIARFWNAVDRHRGSMQRNFLQTDRLAMPATGTSTDELSTLTHTAPSSTEKSRKSNIKRAMLKVKQIDNSVFKELMDYRKRIHKHRETLKAARTTYA